MLYAGAQRSCFPCNHNARQRLCYVGTVYLHRGQVCGLQPFEAMLRLQISTLLDMSDEWMLKVKGKAETWGRIAALERRCLPMMCEDSPLVILRMCQCGVTPMR